MSAKRMKVTVTQKDINAGSRGSCERCPIARAVKKLFPVQKVTVSDNIEVYSANIGGPSKVFELSRSADRFIQRFDNKGRKAVKPFSFYANPL